MYATYASQPGVETAQAAEARSELFWPIVKLGTFGAGLGQVQEVQVPGPAYFPQSPCGVCRAAADAAVQAAALREGRSPFGQAGGSADPATIGKLVAGASALAALVLFGATLLQGRRR